MTKAEEQFRHAEKIKNKDIIIFDTSYNGHKHYYKFKDIINFHINKSNKENLLEILGIEN